VAAKLEGAQCLDIVYISASLTRAKLGERAAQGLGRGVNPSGVPPLIAGSFTGENRRIGNVGREFGGWRGRGVEDKVANADEDSGSKQVPFSCCLLFFGPKELSFSFCDEVSCVPELEHGRSVARDFSHYTDVIKGGNCAINKEALSDMGIKHSKAHVMDIWVLLGVNWVRMGVGVCKVSHRWGYWQHGILRWWGSRFGGCSGCSGTVACA